MDIWWQRKKFTIAIWRRSNNPASNLCYACLWLALVRLACHGKGRPASTSHQLHMMMFNIACINVVPIASYLMYRSKGVGLYSSSTWKFFIVLTLFFTHKIDQTAKAINACCSRVSRPKSHKNDAFDPQPFAQCINTIQNAQKQSALTTAGLLPRRSSLITSLNSVDHHLRHLSTMIDLLISMGMC